MIISNLKGNPLKQHSSILVRHVLDVTLLLHTWFKWGVDIRLQQSLMRSWSFEICVLEQGNIQNTQGRTEQHGCKTLGLNQIDIWTWRFLLRNSRVCTMKSILKASKTCILLNTQPEFVWHKCSRRKHMVQRMRQPNTGSFYSIYFLVLLSLLTF